MQRSFNKHDYLSKVFQSFRAPWFLFAWQSLPQKKRRGKKREKSSQRAWQLYGWRCPWANISFLMLSPFSGVRCCVNRASLFSSIYGEPFPWKTRVDGLWLLILPWDGLFRPSSSLTSVYGEWSMYANKRCLVFPRFNGLLPSLALKIHGTSSGHEPLSRRRQVRPCKQRLTNWYN